MKDILFFLSDRVFDSYGLNESTLDRGDVRNAEVFYWEKTRGIKYGNGRNR